MADQIIDIKMPQDSDGLWDINLDENGDLEGDDSFNTTIECSITWYKRASADEITNPRDRRGWIGDTIADIPGFETGSKLWLFSQARNTDNTLNGTQRAVEEALIWMVEQDLIKNVAVTNFYTDPSTIDADIIIQTLSGDTQSYLFTAWKNTGI